MARRRNSKPLTPSKAYVRLIEMAEKAARAHPADARTHAQQYFIDACLLGASFIEEMSGSWHPDIMLRVTHKRESRRLRIALKREGLE